MISTDIQVRIVFLDRDGVINRDSPAYIKSWAEFDFLPGSLVALRRLTTAGFTLIIVTNQSAVNRGMLRPGKLADMHRKLKAAAAAEGGHIADIFFCPHRPDESCACRKPQPEMILKACRKHRIRPLQSIMIGDSVRDIECAHNAGCREAVLVKTGNGVKSARELACRSNSVAYVAEDLADAAAWILGRYR